MVTSILEPNVAIYERLGFNLVRTGEVADEGIVVKVYPSVGIIDGSSIVCSESQCVLNKELESVDVINSIVHYFAAFPYPGNPYTYTSFPNLPSLASSLCNHTISISLSGFSRYCAINSAYDQRHMNSPRYLRPHHSKRSIFRTGKCKQQSLRRQRRYLIQKQLSVLPISPTPT